MKPAQRTTRHRNALAHWLTAVAAALALVAPAWAQYASDQVQPTHWASGLLPVRNHESAGTTSSVFSPPPLTVNGVAVAVPTVSGPTVTVPVVAGLVTSGPVVGESVVESRASTPLFQQPIYSQRVFQPLPQAAGGYTFLAPPLKLAAAVPDLADDSTVYEMMPDETTAGELVVDNATTFDAEYLNNNLQYDDELCFDHLDVPRYVGCPDAYPCRPHSSYMRSLGRFGLVAPTAPGVESVHSPIFSTGPPLDGYGPSEPFPCEPCHEGFMADPRSRVTPFSTNDFTPDPFFDHLPYNDCAEQSVYGGKYLTRTQRPLIELGMPFYLNGLVPMPSAFFGETNLSVPRFYAYGDYRAAFAHNKQNGQDLGVLANRLNLELDLWLTSTERIHMFTGPMQDGAGFMRVEFDDDGSRFVDDAEFFDKDTDTLFFEGDLGYMTGGLLGQYAAFEMPIAAGLIPLLFQNGVWMEDAVIGMAMTIPAKNSPKFDWSNYDVTFFAATDQVTSPAFAGQISQAEFFGATTFIEAKGGYLEAGYAYVHDTAPGADLSYNNIGISYTRRYLNLFSNSVRVIVNAGQDLPSDQRTADGVLLLSEHSFLTPWPYNVIPYVNLFAGFDKPQSVARAGAAGGVLRNTGILFESDNLTGFPTLDATGNDTYGAAFGIDLLAPNFTQQLILEAAVLQVFGDPVTRNAPGDQYGVGLRYQIPINNAQLIRIDAMQGWLENADNIAGARVEFRWKF